MFDYIVQVCYDGSVEYRTVQASSYDEAKEIVLSQTNSGRIIAVVKQKGSTAS